MITNEMFSDMMNVLNEINDGIKKITKKAKNGTTEKAKIPKIENQELKSKIQTADKIIPENIPVKRTRRKRKAN